MKEPKGKVVGKKKINNYDFYDEINRNKGMSI